MDSLISYIFEAGMLKRVTRSGWWTENIKNPESVADHSFRTALVAFILAKMEGLDDAAANRVCTAAVFHDMHETRLLDLNKITARYIEVTRELELKVENEQVEKFEPKIKKSILNALKLSPVELAILKDADYLECAIQAKEYADIGYNTEKWIDNTAKRLKTKSAKALVKKLKKADSGTWRNNLRK